MSPTDETRLNRIAELRDELDRVHAALFAEIREAFPETRGEPKVRGRMAQVAAASRYSREYVARIRDGRAGESSTA